MFKEKLARKLIEQYIGSYNIEKVVSTNTVKLRLPASMRIHPVMNISRIVRYRKPVGAKDRETKTNRDRWKGEVESQENSQQENNTRICEVFG